MTSKTDEVVKKRGPKKNKKVVQETAKAQPANEFGGPIGVALMMLCLPICAYYLWLSVEFNKGALLSPTAFFSSTNSTATNSTETEEDLESELNVWTFLTENACPTVFSVAVYLAWIVLQAALAYFAPGPVVEGALLADGSRLKYKLNGLFAWYTTLALAAVLHVTGVFPLQWLVESFGPLLSTAFVFATALSIFSYVSAIVKGAGTRMSGVAHYDFFMGAELNPRIGDFDIKFFVEIRPGVMLWCLLTLSCLAKQYELFGNVTFPMILLSFFHLCYANACYNGEASIPMSMDIIHEKFGWMLCFGNLVWVPFVYCIPAFFLLHATTVEPPLMFALLMLCSHLYGYYIFDTANSQKAFFRASDPETHERRGFPTFESGRLTDPRYIPTDVADKALLCDGWWAVARHINYTGDLIMAWTWAVSCFAFNYFIPFFYAIYLTSLLIHRERRDDRACQRKYGAAWRKYCGAVRFRLLPGLY